MTKVAAQLVNVIAKIEGYRYGNLVNRVISAKVLDGADSSIWDEVSSHERWNCGAVGTSALPEPVKSPRTGAVLLRSNFEPWREDVRVNDRSGRDLPGSRHPAVDGLTRAQLDVLLLVDQHLSSKEIAAELGISPHTVDQRIRQALQKLGVERRSQAARLVAGEHGPYQRLIHQSPHIDGAPPAGHSEAAVGFQIRHADRAGKAGNLGFDTEQRPGTSSPSLPLPFATRSNPRNEMSVGFRLLWIVLIAVGAAFSAGMYLAGLESLGRMLSN